MEQTIQTPKTNGNGQLEPRKSRPNAADSSHNGHINIFDPYKYMLKLIGASSLMLSSWLTKPL